MMSLVDMIINKVTGTSLVLLRDYLVSKHGKETDICVLYGDGKSMLRFDTTHTDGVIPLKALSSLRRMIGENVFRTFGHPKEDRIPRVYLVPMPSAIKTIGFWDFLDYYNNDWVGNSTIDTEVGEIPVVIYK